MFWERWSGPDCVVDDSHLERLTAKYSSAWACRASSAWYPAGPDAYTVDHPVAVPPVPVSTPLYDHVHVQPVDGAGHFAPLEYPETMADAVLATLHP